MKDNRKNRKRRQLKRKFYFINGVIPFKVGCYYKLASDLELDFKNDVDIVLNKQFERTLNKYKLNKYKHLFILIKENESVGFVNDDFIKDIKTILFERVYKSKKSNEIYNSK